MEASRLVRKLGGQHRGGDGPQESVGHLGVDHHRLEAVVGRHRGQRGLLAEAMEPFMAAVVL